MRVEKVFDILHKYFKLEGMKSDADANYYLSCAADDIIEMIDNTPILLECEGYQMFKGTMRITPKNNVAPPFEITTTWLYKPEYDCWYGNGRSFVADICTIVEAVVL